MNTNPSGINGDSHPRIQMQEPVNYMTKNQELILDAPTQESTIQELEIQVSLIQESKM